MVSSEDFIGGPPAISLDDDPRQDAFGRLIVRLFEAVIANEEYPARVDGRIPRIAVRDVIAMVKQAVGDGALAEYQTLCREVLVRVSKGRRMPNWNAFYDDDSAKDIQQSILIRLAFHLERFAPSAHAFAVLVNTNGGKGLENGR